MKVRKFLREKREAKGITQLKMARALGLSSSQFVSNIERGLASIPVPKIKLYAQILGVNEKELFEVVQKDKIAEMEAKYKMKENTGTSVTSSKFTNFFQEIETCSDKEKATIKSALSELIKAI